MGEVVAAYWPLITIVALFFYALGLRPRETPIRTIKDCPEGRECPYTIICRDSGGLLPKVSYRVDTETMFQCCKFQRDCEAIDRIFRSQHETD